MASKVKVEGVPEAVRAFDKVQLEVQDLSEAHQAEAEMLLPDVRDATRRKSGTLIAGWQTEGMATEARFINEVPYAGVQEFGWSDHNIEPTNAITGAFERNAERTEAIYSEAVERIASKAGFETK